MMEYFPASGHAPSLPACLEMVAEAEAVVVIVSHRYGWVPDDPANPDAKSITWLECDHARHVTQTGDGGRGGSCGGHRGASLRLGTGRSGEPRCEEHYLARMRSRAARDTEGSAGLPGGPGLLLARGIV